MTINKGIILLVNLEIEGKKHDDHCHKEEQEHNLHWVSEPRLLYDNWNLSEEADGDDELDQSCKKLYCNIHRLTHYQELIDHEDEELKALHIENELVKIHFASCWNK